METIKLDLIPGKKMPSLHASQYDDGREHGIDLFENGVAYNLDGTETLTINERKGDDCICSLDIENTFAETNHIVFASTEQMCAVWGNNICELVIAKGEKTIGTLNFILEIEQSPTEGGIESESEIKNLERQIEAITEEVIGDDYYTAEQTDEAIATAIEGKADTTYVDTELAKKADKTDTYTKTQVDTALNGKADKDTTYTKTQVDSEISRLDGRIDNLPAPMIFEGTLGVGGTIQSLPTASASNEGFTYKVITDGTYAGQTAKVGDVFTSNGSAWVYIPSGDEDNDTWRAIKVNGTEELGSGISSGSVDFVGSENIDVEFDSNGNKIGIKTKNIYTKAEVNDIVAEAIYDVLPSDVASGSVANFETDLALSLKSLEIDVNAKRDLHGYSYPWPAGGGKNLLKTSGLSLVPPSDTTFSNVTKRTFASNCFCTGLSANNYYQDNKVSQYEVSENFISVTTSAAAYAILIPVTGLVVGETYTLSATADKGNFTVGFWQEDGTFIRTENVSITKVTFVVPENTHWVGLAFRPIDANIQATYTNIQLEKGSTATAFEPYENICPIEGWSEISLTKCGKNLLNVMPLIDDNYYSLNSDGSLKVLQSDNRGWNNVSVITRLKKGTYTLSRSFASGYCDVRTSLNNYSSGIIMELSQTSKTFTLSDDADIKVKFGYGLQSGYPFDCFFNISVGSSESTYEPYNGNTEVINLGGTYYGGHFTQDKAGHRQFEATHSELLDMSDLTWVNFLPASNIFRANVPNCKSPADNADRKNGFLCSTYPASSNVSINANMTDKSLLRFGGYLILRDTSYSDYTELASGLSGAKLIYELATPYVIDLPDGEPIITLNGTNNIYADTGDCAVEYKVSIEQYVSNHSGGGLGGGLLGGGLGGAKSGGSEEEPTEESEDTEKTKEIDEPKEEIKTIGDMKKLGGE